MTSERDLSRFWCWHSDAQIMARNVLGILLLRNFMERMTLLFSSAELADIVLARHVGRRFSD